MRAKPDTSPSKRGMNVSALLAPASIAVVGATPDLSKPGGRFLANLTRYRYVGQIFAVNPNYSTAEGIEYYPDLLSLPKPVDLAALVVPARVVPGYLRQAAQTGIRSVMIVSSGFAEAGPDGQALQDEVNEIARQAGIAVLGPNSLGLTDVNRGLVASFSNAFSDGQSFSGGDIAFVSQSGAMGAAVFIQAQASRIGVSRFISTGNEAVLGMADLIESLVDDPEISTILCYIEGIKDGAVFVQAAQRARAHGKDIVAVKVGKSEAGAAAAKSHTGSIVSGAAVYSAAFRRAGLAEVQTVQQLIDVAIAMPVRRSVRGNRVGIVSSSGGAAVIMADACSLDGLSVNPFAEATLSRLAKILPAYAGFSNPVDYGPVYGDPEAIGAILHAIAADPAVDVVLFFLALSPAMVGVIDQHLARVQEESGKPVIAVWMAPPAGAIAALRERGVAAYDDANRAVRVLHHLVRANSAHGPVTPPPFNGARQRATQTALAEQITAGREMLSERETKTLLAKYGLPVTRDVLVSSPEQAEIAVRNTDGLAVIKADAHDLMHKTEAGAVRLRVTGETARADYAAVVAGASSRLGRTIVDAVVQPMVRPGFEIIVGLKHDDQFGPTISVGLGGVMTEVLADVVTELAPVDQPTALSMLDGLKGARLLNAFRGRPALDREALAEVLVSLSAFALEAGSMVAELDLNPVIVHPVGEGCVIVDAAALLARNGTGREHV